MQDQIVQDQIMQDQMTHGTMMRADTAFGETVDGDRLHRFHAGDHVALIDDDWSEIGHDIVLVEVEPVPGSTQCLVTSDGVPRTVSRLRLRPLGAAVTP